MKFGKLFMHQIQETVPEWRNKFLSYKKLKKLIRKIPECGNAEEKFLSLLKNDIDTLNEFFSDKEEEFIIRYQELQQDQKKSIDLCGPNGTQPSETDYKERMDILLKHIVDLHSEMILLLNLWNINQTGFAKLVKKYEKRTSGLQRYPLLQKVLEHQFLTSEFIPKLVTECESIIDEVIFHVGENSKTPNEEAIASNGEPLLPTQHDAAVVVKEGEVSEPNLEKSLRALGKYRDNFSLQSLVPLCLNEMTYCSCWRCFLYDSANELLFCLFPTCVGQSKFEI